MSRIQVSIKTISYIITKVFSYQINKTFSLFLSKYIFKRKKKKDFLTIKNVKVCLVTFFENCFFVLKNKEHMKTHLIFLFVLKNTLNIQNIKFKNNNSF